MILALAVILGVGVGLARGGRLNGLSQVRVRGVVAIFLLFAAQTLIRQIGPLLGLVGSSALVWLWCVLSVGLIVVCVINWGIRGIPLVALGVALNLLVVTLNAGMPVGGPLAASYDMNPTANSVASHGGFYRGVDTQTVAVALGDVIPIPAPRPLRAIVSFGDVLMLLGVAVLVEESVYGGRYRGRHSVSPSQ